MAVVCSIQITYDGTLVRGEGVIPGEAHSLGLSPDRRVHHAHMLDDLGSPEGSGVIEAVLARVVSGLASSIRSQWSGEQPLF